MATKHIHPTWRAEVSDEGKLTIQERERFDRYVERYAGKDNMAVIVKPYRKSKSRQEERYYHAVPKMMIAEAMDMTPEEAHQFLCDMFLTEEKSVTVNGQKMRYTRTKSTTELNDAEYHDFVFERVLRWASLPTGDGLDQNSGLGLYIPLPNEVDYENYF